MFFCLIFIKPTCIEMFSKSITVLMTCLERPVEKTDDKNIANKKQDNHRLQILARYDGPVMFDVMVCFDVIFGPILQW